MSRVVVIGGGGHGSVVLEVLLATQPMPVHGVLDGNPARHGDTLLGVPVLGGDALLAELGDAGVTHFVIGVGSVGDAALRRKLYGLALDHGYQPLTVVHPRATVASSATVGAGSVVLAGAVVNTNAQCGVNVIINTGAIVEHDCIVGDHAHIATGARMGGDVYIGGGAHIGLGASLLQGIRVGENAIVGAGAVVVRAVPPGMTVVGVPAAPVVSKG